MKSHAKYAASSSKRWMNCPGSIKRTEGLVQPKSSRAAEEGTKAHFLMEYALNANIKSVIDHFKDPRDGMYPHEMRFHVEKFVAFVRDECKRGFDLLVEEKIKLDFLHGSEAFGTVDVAIVEPFGALHVIDFKYGREDVDHVDNPQMIYYALGIAHRLYYDVETIRTTIYQPRGERTARRSFDFSLDYLLNWKELFKAAIEACENADPDQDLKPGAYCKYCLAMNDCPALKADKLSRAQKVFNKQK